MVSLWEITIMSGSNLKRQLNDLLHQAERLIQSKCTVQEIREFGNYSEELKQYIIDTTQDDFVLERVHAIPKIDLNPAKSKANYIAAFSGVFGTLFVERNQVNQGKEQIREIRDKFSSVEFLLRNQDL